MSRQLEMYGEDRMARRHKALVRALEFELVRKLQEASLELTGFSVRIREWECLMTLRAEGEAGSLVAFVGAEDVVGVLIKSVRQAAAGKLQWKEDNYRAVGG